MGECAAPIITGRGFLQEIGFLVFLLILALLGIAFISSPVV